MQKRKVIFLTAAALLAVAAVAHGATDGAKQMMNLDVETSKTLTKGLAHLGTGFPAFASIMLPFYIFQSFIMTMLTDQQYHRWGIRVMMSLMIGTAFMGGSISQALGMKSGAGTKSRAIVTQMVFDKLPGAGAKEAALLTSSATNFETMAVAFDGDGEEMAEGASGNMAAVQTITPDEHTRWALDYGHDGKQDIQASETIPDDRKALDNSVREMNEVEEKAGVLSGSLLYFINAVSTVAGDIQAQYDAKIISQAQIVADLENGTNVSGELTGSNVDDLFAAATTDTSKAFLPVATSATYPGGFTEYGQHVLKFVADPSRAYTNAAIPGPQMVAAIKTGNAMPSTLVDGPGTVVDEARKLGFDANTEGVAPQMFLRTHLKLQAEECSGGAIGMTAGTAAIKNVTSSALNPCNQVINDPLQGLDKKATSLANSIFNIFLNLTSGTAAGSITGLKDALSMSAQLDKVKTGFSFSQLEACKSRATDFKGVLGQYDAVAKAATDAGVTSAATCTKNAKSIAIAMESVTKNRVTNSTSFAEYLEPSGNPGVMAEADSTLAFTVSTDKTAPNETENLASLSSMVNHVVGAVGAIGVTGHSASANTTPPTTTASTRGAGKSSTLEQKTAGSALETIQHGKNTWKLIKDGKLPSAFNEAIQTGISAAGTAIEGLATTVKNIALMAWNVVILLFAAAPLMALITQASLAITIATFSYSLGMAMVPIWAVMNMGKMFSGSSAGDESYNGMSFFPVVVLGVTFAALGAELASAAVVKGEMMYYITHVSELFLAQLTSLGKAFWVAISAGTVFEGGSDSLKGIIGPMMLATKPFGIISATVLGPMLIARMLAPGVISPHGAQSTIGGMASMAGGNHSAAAAGAGAAIQKVAGFAKKAVGAAVGGALGGPAGAAAGAKVADKVGSK